MTLSIGDDLKTKRFWKRFLLGTFSAVGLTSSVLGLFDVLFPSVLPGFTPWLVFLIGIVSIFLGANYAWPRPIQEHYSAPDTEIRVVRGDYFDSHSAHLVIGMCDTFDTRVPIIAASSLQNQFLVKAYGGDRDKLDREIQSALSDVSIKERVEKEGNQDRYELGTVAVLDGINRMFLLLAYTEMDESNNARGTTDGLWQSLSSLWTVARSRTNGGIIRIPVIGGGQARVSQFLPAQDSIRFIALSFMLASRREKVCPVLEIVVSPAQYDKLDKLEIPAFLSSLKPS